MIGPTKFVAIVLITVAPACAVEVQQPDSDLIWLRCPVWQVSIGSGCYGPAREPDWDDAQDVCPAGYRVPSSADYGSMLNDCDTAGSSCSSCANSSTCSYMFGEDIDRYWTSSYDGLNPKRAFYTNFSGGIFHTEKKRPRRVRCVKGAR